ncbi:rRNA N6-adenosine-methyltransferase ZCCHC4-like [Daphnia pulex]|uniref:rRNA N6-adenosine-methyltransferase ZCCHC4-like n=1 Tax=Daphnia pulex TaxID=6669 RepID=UPI001EDF85F3|nr:rRNA N6-adenosine-methyltransferase ZCCHC4-like [Daphnia pulex]
MKHNQCDNGFRDSVQIKLDFLGERPSCDHGPMLLFEKSSNVDKRFFACSAYRDRKLCSAYVLETDWKNDKEKEPKESQLLSTSRKLDYIRENILDKPDSSVEYKSYCHSCGELFVHDEKHVNHQITKRISEDLLKKPSQFLDPLDHSKKEAQYFFSENSINVILGLLQDAKVNHVLCIACPTIFERLRNDGSKKCLMLDLDIRFRQFYGPQEYLLYNMFNHHFFNGIEGFSIYEQFLKEAKNNLAVVMDPPFGGKVEIIAHTLRKIDGEYKRLNGVKSSEISNFWIFPYFMESQILNKLPNFAMLDYKIEYTNHSQFQKGPKGRKQGSPVRIFTNVNLQKLKLPASEGYRYCGLCKKWISPENKHCSSCNSCTSKDGRTYVHCVKCQRCVKPTWIHCVKCNRCALAEHPCMLFQERTKEVANLKKIKTDSFSIAKSTTKWTVTEHRNT